MVFTVTLNPAIDYVIQTDQPLQLGAVNRNCAEAIHFGGKGINVSCVLQELGVDSIALGFIAGFTGKGLEQGLQRQGLNTDFITVADGLTRINVKITGQPETQINGMGPRITQKEMEQLLDRLSRLTEQDVLVLSGSSPSCLGQEVYGNLLAAVSQKHIPVVVDASGELLCRTLPHRPFLVKPNHLELGELFGLELETDQQIVCCAEQLQKMGAENVLVSMGERGAILLDAQGKLHRISCPSGQVVSTVCAGDAMVAGFLAGYLQTGSYDYALRLGTAAGSATAFSVGIATKEQIFGLLARIQ